MKFEYFRLQNILEKATERKNLILMVPDFEVLDLELQKANSGTRFCSTRLFKYDNIPKRGFFENRALG